MNLANLSWTSLLREEMGKRKRKARKSVVRNQETPPQPEPEQSFEISVPAAASPTTPPLVMARQTIPVGTLGDQIVDDIRNLSLQQVTELRRVIDVVRPEVALQEMVEQQQFEKQLLTVEPPPEMAQRQQSEEDPFNIGEPQRESSRTDFARLEELTDSSATEDNFFTFTEPKQFTDRLSEFIPSTSKKGATLLRMEDGGTVTAKQFLREAKSTDNESALEEVLNLVGDDVVIIPDSAQMLIRAAQAQREYLEDLKGGIEARRHRIKLSSLIADTQGFENEFQRLDIRVNQLKDERDMQNNNAKLRSVYTDLINEMTLNVFRAFKAELDAEIEQRKFEVNLEREKVKELQRANIQSDVSHQSKPLFDFSKLELKKFNGDLVAWPEFRNTFARRVASARVADEEKRRALIQYLGPNVNTGTAATYMSFEMLWNHLDRFYGDEKRLQRHLLKKINSLKLDNSSFEALERYAKDLVHLTSVFESISDSKGIEESFANGILSQLPVNVKTAITADRRTDITRLPAKELIQAVQEYIERFRGVYETENIGSSDTVAAVTSYGLQKKKMSNQSQSSQSSVTNNKCAICGEKHSIADCNASVKKKVDYFFPATGYACFACGQKFDQYRELMRHSKKTCPKTLKCSKCEKTKLHMTSICANVNDYFSKCKQRVNRQNYSKNRSGQNELAAPVVDSPVRPVPHGQEQQMPVVTAGKWQQPQAVGPSADHLMSLWAGPAPEGATAMPSPMRPTVCSSPGNITTVTPASTQPRFTTRTSTAPHATSIPRTQVPNFTSARNLDEIILASKQAHMATLNTEGSNYLPILPVGSLFGFLDCGATSSFCTYDAVAAFDLKIIGHRSIYVNAFNSGQQPILVQYPVVKFYIPGVGVVLLMVADQILQPVDTSKYAFEQYFPGVKLPKLNESTTLDFLFANDLFARLVNKWSKSPLSPTHYLFDTKLGLTVGGSCQVEVACQYAITQEAPREIPQNVGEAPEITRDKEMSKNVRDFFSLAALGLGEEQMEHGNNFLKRLALSYDQKDQTYTVKIPWIHEQGPPVQNSLKSAQ